MDMEKTIARAEQNIRTAIADYGRHTTQKTVLEDITDTFIHKLAVDSSYAKQGLRELFSKSPAWHPELDAIVINGTRTRDPDYDRAFDIERRILDKPWTELWDEPFEQLRNAMMWFVCPNASDEDKEVYLNALHKIAPKAYAPGKKPSRVFKAFCKALGVVDETAGSEFQKLFAQFADELSTKKIDYKLYVSINPAHFLTMSNPKEDTRGKMLTSCHSLNSTEYNYNCGCTGYARDEVSFIVFTVDDPSNPELLNNRKTSRQVFAYRPGSGLLLQSRMYNTSGGVYGAAAESDVYRDLIQREICDLEGAVNLWNTGSSYSKYEYYVETGMGFGGYPDWIYDEFDGHISIRKDAEDPDPLVVGTEGLCVVCGEPITSSTYCKKHRPKPYHCDHCGEGCDDVYRAVDAEGNAIRVCRECLDTYYERCEVCGTYHAKGSIQVFDGRHVCNHCIDVNTRVCAICGEVHLKDNMFRAVIGDYVEWVCNEHASELRRCRNCGILHDSNIACPACGLDIIVPNQPTFEYISRSSWYDI